MLQASLNLPDGTPCSSVAIGIATLNLTTLDMDIEVVGRDVDGNKRVVVHVPYKIQELRDVPIEEQTEAVNAYFAKK